MMINGLEGIYCTSLLGNEGNYSAVANPGLEVGSCGNAILLSPPNNRTAVPRYLLFLLLFSQVFPGTFPLEPMVNPTTQASSF
jgi:hypothetical protein